MNKLKLNYEQPCSEVLVVRFEGSLLNNVSGPGSASSGYDGNGQDLGDLDD